MNKFYFGKIGILRIYLVYEINSAFFFFLWFSDLIFLPEF